MDNFAAKLKKREADGTLRSLALPSNGVDFASNDYLGLAKSSLLAKCVSTEMQTHNVVSNGSTGARLLTGNSAYAESLEATIAAFHGYSDALLFNCGYMANLGLLSAIAEKEDSIFYDISVHASMQDGIKLSQAKKVPFKHNDMTHLERRLKAHCSKRNNFICVESLYSMNGSRAPLKELAALARHFHAYLIVDEAHAVGIAGPNGRGYIAEYGLQDQIFAQIVTFGKALGSHGAAILSSKQLKQILINFCRPFVYSTALPFHTLATIKSSYEIFPQMDAERTHLTKLIGLIPHAASVVFPIQIKGAHALIQAADILHGAGFNIFPIRSPTVKRGAKCLRLCLHSFNTEEEIKFFFKTLQPIWQPCAV